MENNFKMVNNKNFFANNKYLSRSSSSVCRNCKKLFPPLILKGLSKFLQCRKFVYCCQ